MVDKSIFFTRPDNFLKIENEVVLGKYKNIEMWEKTAKFRLDGLDLQITTHRLLVSSELNKQIGYAINLENVIEYKEIVINFLIAKEGSINVQLYKFDIKKQGLVFKKLVAFKVKYNNQTKIEFRIQKGLEDSIAQVKGALSKKEWLKKPPPKMGDQLFQNQNIYSGLKDIQKREEQKQLDQQKIVSSSFQKGDISGLFSNARELKEISTYLKSNLSRLDKSHEQTELDNMLQDLGYFNVITKQESGNNYLDDLARQIYTMCNELFPKLGGIITLIDVFYFINKKRQTCLLNPQEVLDACNRFQKLGLNAIVQEYGNVKVIEQSSFDTEKDFQDNIGKFITYTEGITADQLARKLKIPPVICRIKLNKATNLGKLILDDSIEGQTYYKNIILDFYK